MMIIKKLIAKIKVWYADIRGHHGRDGIMKLVIGIWADIKKLIKGENNMEDKPTKKIW